jgi:2-polyprenyl-6-hydroxyphenyl methylase/3-demethylubiquinone-9 3-methyltransferase
MRNGNLPVVTTQMGPQASSVRAEEIARFDALAADWWDPDGPMRPLHRMNPARIAWILSRIRRRFPEPAGLSLLDVGCGGGLAAEALAGAGLDVLGIDAAPAAIAAARAHAAGAGFSLVYQEATAEKLAAEGKKYQVITALEVIEHVADPAAFVAVLADLLAPGGMLFVSTLNRTARSFLTAKVGAEFLLRWLPVGTHDWRRFLTPAEAGAQLRAAGLLVTDIAGLTPDFVRGGWRTGRDLSVNYILAAEAG